MGKASRSACAFAIASLVACGGPNEPTGGTTAASSAHEPAPDQVMASRPAPAPSPQPAMGRVVDATAAFDGMSVPPAAWLACSADTDCAVVEVGCCDHCNGGRVVSVATGQAHAAESRYRPADCDRACTERACAGAEPVCVEGRCGYRAMWMTQTPPAP